MENKATFTAEEFKALCREAIPALNNLQEVLKQRGIIGPTRIYFSGDGYINMEGSGFHGWEMSKYKEDRDYTVKYGYSERFSMDEEVQE